MKYQFSLVPNPLKPLHLFSSVTDKLVVWKVITSVNCLGQVSTRKIWIPEGQLWVRSALYMSSLSTVCVKFEILQTFLWVCISATLWCHPVSVWLLLVIALSIVSSGVHVQTDFITHHDVGIQHAEAGMINNQLSLGGYGISFLHHKHWQGITNFCDFLFFFCTPTNGCISLGFSFRVRI